MGRLGAKACKNRRQSKSAKPNSLFFIAASKKSITFAEDLAFIIMATALKIAEKSNPIIPPTHQTMLGNGSCAYYSASEFRKLAQEDLQRLLKKYGRI